MQNQPSFGTRKKSWFELDYDDDKSDDGAMSPLLSEGETTTAEVPTSLIQSSNNATIKGITTSEQPKVIGYSLFQQLLQIIFQCFVVTASRLVNWKDGHLYKNNSLLYQHVDADEEEHEVECYDYMNADYFHPGSIVGGSNFSSPTVVMDKPPVDLKQESLQVLGHAPMILSLDMMSQLAKYCFEHGSFSITGLKRWKRLYSVARDGDSFTSFLNHVQNEKHTILVVKTMVGDTILGAFVDTEWRKCGGGNGGSASRGSASSLSPRYYGTGHSFLFSFNPKLSVYKWTGKNNYNQLCEGGRIALGGGGHDANFGLCIEDCFRKGSSGNCETFNNLPLAGINNEFFDVLAFEVYGFENSW